MDFFQLFADLERVDPEVYARFDSRRRVFRHLGTAGRRLTAAALPALVGAFFNKAYGQSGADIGKIASVLKLALQLEYLEYYFYDSALNSPGLSLGADRAAIELIRNDEAGHIKVLRQALANIGQTPANDPGLADPGRAAFDYSGGGGSGAGPFAQVFGSLPLFYGVARSFVDTGIRAYKGGAADLFRASAAKELLETALSIHSVEARHAAHLRAQQRGGADQPGDLSNLSTKPKSWVSGRDSGGASPATTPSTAPVYGPGTTTDVPAEDNRLQLNVDVRSNTGFSLLSSLAQPVAADEAAQQTAAATEAFDEPLDAATVKAIARNFRSATAAGQLLFA